MQSISIIGAGNVAWHLLESFTLAGLEVLEVFGRNPKDHDAFEAFGHTDYISDIKKVSPSADIYFVCVRDDAIEDVMNSLPFRPDNDQIIVHTSGARPSTILAPFAQHYGCFWPVQTMTKEAPVLSNDFPVIFNGSDKDTETTLSMIADLISDNFLLMSDEKKQAMHLAAVIVNNFTNHLYTLASDYCMEEHIDFTFLSSIIRETALKISQQDPGEIQTGPAVRNDRLTIEKHLSALEKHPELYKLYCMFTDSIMNKYHRS
ncbi:MAG: DUF2520 domain-containing protein [Saprospiraceae bacterium]|nr:DUF2520 domain-containing protein [Saprospiraceae bacterium]